jgi:hypothetical protein
MAMAPYNSLKGVNLVALDSVVLCHQMTLIAHLPTFLSFDQRGIFFMVVKTCLLALSTTSFNCGSYTYAKWTEILTVELLSIVEC